MYKKTLLPNHLRVISHEMKDRDSVSIGVWIAAGGRHENKKNKGTTHFLEHSLFKGSEKYSCEEIKEEIEGVGGTLNAFTGEEYTCYFAKIPAKHLKRTFDILADMVLHPLIAKKDVDKERTVILEEIKMYHDQPQHYVVELLEELMWPNHPLGMNLTGTFESVGSMSREDLRHFHQSSYSLSNIVVAACGRLKHQDLVQLVRSKSKGLNGKRGIDFLKADNSQEKIKVKFFRKDVEQMHVALGAFGLENDHKDKHAYHLVNIILGGNMSSRLFNEVREKRGLAYAISSAAKSLKDTGLLMINAGVDNKKVIDALSVILKELEKIKSREVTKNEFLRAKDYYLGQILLGLEDTLEHMFWIGERLVSLNKTQTIHEVFQALKKVTISDIKRVAGNIFKRQHMNLAIVGPLESAQEKKLSALMGVKE